MILRNIDMSNYAATVPDDYQEQATEMAERTVLTERQAEVAILSNAGVTRQTISDELGIGKNTVDEHKQRVKRQIRRARNTLDDPRLQMFVERADAQAVSATADVDEGDA